MRFWLRNKVDVEKKLSEKEEEPISFVKLVSTSNLVSWFIYITIYMN